MPLDLNIVYYHIQISKNVSNLCRIILPWAKYFYKHLPMGFADSPEILQHRMNDLFDGFEFIRAYMDYLWVLTGVKCRDHVQNLKLALNKMKGKWLKCNIERSLFGKIEMRYFGFEATGHGIKPIYKKI